MPEMGAFHDDPTSQALVTLNDGEEDMSDNFAMLEDAYQQTAIDVEGQIHYFAQQLDNCFISRGTLTEQRAKIFKLLDLYYSYAKQRADIEDPGNDMDVDDDYSPKAHNWEEEAHTWDLLRRLLPLKYRDKSAPLLPRGKQPPPRSRIQYFAEFLQSEPRAKELKTVLEWLQSNARSRPDIEEMVKDLQRSAERGDIVSYGWLHTKGMIKQHKRLVATSDPVPADADGLGNSKLEVPDKRVTQLDPDVRLRQAGRKLAPQDVFFERAVWLGCFELLRRGRNMAEIRDWCQERTELWRAASMSALPLSLGEDEDLSSFEPSTLVLWRQMCLKLAADTSIEDEYERAVYGVLSGQRNAVDKVAKCWDDFQFAKYNATLREHFDQYLQQDLASGSLGPSLLYSGGGSHIMDMDLPHRKPATVLKSLQDSVIQDKLDNFMHQQGLHLAVEANQKIESKIVPIFETPSPPRSDDKILKIRDADGLRVLAHVLIIISALDKLDGKDPLQLGHFRTRHETQEHVIALYTSQLRLLRMTEAIPLYASRLNGDRRYTNMSRNLVHLDSIELKTGALQYMQKLGLDMHTFVKTGPQMYLSEVDDRPGVCPAKGKFSILYDDPPTLKYGRLIKRSVFGEDYAAQEMDEYLLDNEDERIIRSMEWLLLVDGLIIEMCQFGVQIYKYFLKHQRLAAARLLANRVPLSLICKQKLGVEHPSQEEADPTWWDSVFNSAAGQMDVDNFADTGLSKEDLVDCARPLWEFECLINSMDCLSTTAMVAEGHRHDPSRDREVASAMDGNAKDLKGFMKPLLKDWLLGSVEEDPDLVLLRETYLPDLIIGYASTLQFAGTTASRDYLLECMELASLIAEKTSDIADLLVKVGRMRELVESFASCSKALAIWTSDVKKGPGASSKKLKEMGWSRELWTVKP